MTDIRDKVPNVDTTGRMTESEAWLAVAKHIARQQHPSETFICWRLGHYKLPLIGPGKRIPAALRTKMKRHLYRFFGNSGTDLSDGNPALWDMDTEAQDERTLACLFLSEMTA
jgi:hypothetical protein